MYNRYVPQADGSFRRSRVPEPIPQDQPSVNPPPPPPEPQRQQAAMQPSSSFTGPRRRSFSAPSRNPPPINSAPHYDNSTASIGSFLKGLLPQNFDTEDLMVVLLLLLMSGNSGSDQNAALMTLVIYLFI